MPVFRYRAADASGRVVSGVVESGSPAEAIRTLERQSLTALTIRPARRSGRRGEAETATTRIRLRTHELLEFTRHLRVMTSSGVTILAALNILRQHARGAYRRLLDRVVAAIQSGATLSEALAEHPRTFDPLYVGTIRAGEVGGIQTEALDELVKYYERNAALRRQLVTALMYPFIVILTLIGASIVMLVWVVPQFKGVFEGLDTQLPLATRVLIGVSDFITGNAAALLGSALALAVAARLLWGWTPFRSGLRRAMGHVPLLGGILYLATVVQFARMLALLEHAGLPLLEALRVVQNMLMPGPVRDLAGSLGAAVASGKSIAEAARESRALPELLEHMIAVGESSGRIDETLAIAADHFEEEMQVRLRRLTTALEPALTMIVSALVLVVAMAVFTPMWKMNRVLLRT